MSERTRLVPQLANLTCTHTLVIESTHECMVHGPCGSWKVGIMCPVDLVFMSTFNDQSMSKGFVGKLRHQSGFLRHYLLIMHGLMCYPNFVKSNNNRFCTSQNNIACTLKILFESTCNFLLRVQINGGSLS